MPPLMSVAEIIRDRETLNGATVKVRGFVSGASGEKFLLDVGREGCEIQGAPALLIDLRAGFQDRIGKANQQIVVLEGKFRNDFYPVKKDSVTGRAIGNDIYVGPLLDPKLLTASSEECAQLGSPIRH